MIYACCDPVRVRLVQEHAVLNGIEYLEVLDDDAPSGSPRQQTLMVGCFKAVGPLEGENVWVAGGTRIKGIQVEWAFPADVVTTKGVLIPAEAALVAGIANPDRVLVVRVDAYGDFSTYTLSLVAGPGLFEPPADYDTVLSSVDFSFKAECPTDFDCCPDPSCLPEPHELPLIDYLAKDYGSLRQLLLDRLALLAPEWTERNPADLGVVLVELLAYAGDSLSYFQDAVGTEAYLDTARRRVSVKRHARLVDYFMHDGCNARAWVQVQVRDSPLVLDSGVQIMGRLSPEAAPVVDKLSSEYRRAIMAGLPVFEPMHRSVLYPSNNQLFFYTWGDEACVLPKGATRATLRDGTVPAERALLRPGDVLIFEEVLGPVSGEPEEADPGRRHAIRLTEVEPAATLNLVNGVEMSRTAGAAIFDPLTNQPIIKIAWTAEDALPFRFCISSPRFDTDLAGQIHQDVSAASGNIVLADHGRTINEPQDLGAVPPGRVLRVAGNECFCDEPEPRLQPGRFRPRLAAGPVSQVGHVVVVDADGSRPAEPFDALGPAAGAFQWDLRRALPAVTLTSDGTESWEPRREVLDSGPSDRHFVVDVDDDGIAQLRFGDGHLGALPEPGSAFEAVYRIGNGLAGHVGAEALVHLIDDGAPGISPLQVVAVRNPLPSHGGLEPESVEEVRRDAPHAFRTQERAVTLDDYREAAMRYRGLQGAAARYRWTGSWRTVFVTPDPLGGDSAAPDTALNSKLRSHLEPFRLAGYDLRVADPVYVSLEVELHICVEPGYFRSDIVQVLNEVLSNRVRQDGSLGLFHPDRFSFGQTMYLSPILHAAQSIEGVQSVAVSLFRRQGRPDQGLALRDGRILLGTHEIARLDNDPSFPERGLLTVKAEGGL